MKKKNKSHLDLTDLEKLTISKNNHHIAKECYRAMCNTINGLKSYLAADIQINWDGRVVVDGEEFYECQLEEQE